MKVKVYLCTMFFCGSLLLPVSAQSNEQLTVKGSGMTLVEAIREIEKDTDYTFFYKSSDLDGKVKVTKELKGDIHEVLDTLFDGSGITYRIQGKEIVLTSSRQPETPRTSPQQQVHKVTITGTVSDETDTLVGATVVEKGNADNGTITDLNGQFHITVNEGATLVVSYIGYLTQEVKVQPGTPLQIQMEQDAQTLDEVVVVGFGTQKKANLTGAVTTVKMDEVLGDRPLVNATDALQGVVPGLLISSGGNSPTDTKSFQIRGAYSIGSGSAIQPLVLIDNVEGDINLLNPDDIETITVMKDAASSAIYGARAAGGVILITTKRPQKAERFTLNYNNNFAFANAINLPKQADLMDYFDAYIEATGNDTYWTLGAPSVSKWKELLTQYRNDPSSVPVQGDGIYRDETTGALYFLNENDLVKDILETSFQQTHNLSISGGTERLRYRLSGGFANRDGVLITDKDLFRRLNVNAFLSADITKWFTQEATLSYAHNVRSLPTAPVGSFYSTDQISYYPEGNMPTGFGIGGDDNLPFITPRNLLLLSNTSKTTYDNPRIFLKSILKPLKGLELVFEYTFDKNIYDYSWYTGTINTTTVQGGSDVYPDTDYLTKTKRHTDYNAFNIYGTYSLDIAKDHHFKLMAGFNQESSYRETLQNYSYGQAIPEVPSLGGGTTKLTATDSYSEYAIRGGFFRFNYNYQEKYLLEVNGRYDGSSKFPKDSRFGFFPSFSAGWNMAREGFMEKASSWLNTFKIRASYGIIGNQNISPYQFVPSMTISNTYQGWLIDKQQVAAITSLPELVSAAFTWEDVITTNIGLDFAFFNNRLTGLFEWYQKNTNGMLAPGMQLPAVVGANAPMQNTADMRTRGWDLQVNWRDRIGEFGYRVGFNLSDYKSIIVNYDSNESKLLSNYYEGQELGEIWGYLYDGFYTVDDFVDTQSWVLKNGVTRLNGTNPRPGDVKFKDLRDDPTLGENIISSGDNTLANPGDRVRIGNNLPRYLYGINIGASYGGFDLNIFMQGTGKRDAWIANALKFPLYGSYKFNPLFEETNDYWQPVDAANGDYTCANPDAKYPRIYGEYGNQGSNYRVSDRYLSDASYLRIKNLTLSYTFPQKWIEKISLNNLRFFLSIENLATFSSLPKGIDPETLSWNYPAFRTTSFGLSLSL